MRTFSLLLALTITIAAGDLAAATINYSYDAAGRITRVDYGNGKGIAYTWDAMGNLVARGPLPPSSGRRRGVRVTELSPANPERLATDAETPVPTAANEDLATTCQVP